MSDDDCPGVEQVLEELVENVIHLENLMKLTEIQSTASILSEYDSGVDAEHDSDYTQNFKHGLDNRNTQREWKLSKENIEREEFKLQKLLQGHGLALDDESSAEDSDGETDSESDDIVIPAEESDMEADVEGDGAEDPLTGPMTENEKHWTENVVPDLPSDEDLKDIGGVTLVGICLHINSESDHEVVSLIVEASKSSLILEAGSIMCDASKNIIGRIEDVFGPVDQPYYVVRIQRNKDIISEKMQIYAVDKFIVKIDHSVIEKQKVFKGSDASNAFNEEIHEEEAEFSDDDDERNFKSKNKKKKQRPEALKGSSSNYTAKQQYRLPNMPMQPLGSGPFNMIPPIPANSPPPHFIIPGVSQQTQQVNPQYQVQPPTYVYMQPPPNSTGYQFSPQMMYPMPVFNQFQPSIPVQQVPQLIQPKPGNHNRNSNLNGMYMHLGRGHSNQNPRPPATNPKRG